MLSLLIVCRANSHDRAATHRLRRVRRCTAASVVELDDELDDDELDPSCVSLSSSSLVTGDTIGEGCLTAFPFPLLGELSSLLVPESESPVVSEARPSNAWLGSGSACSFRFLFDFFRFLFDFCLLPLRFSHARMLPRLYLMAVCGR